MKLIRCFSTALIIGVLFVGVQPARADYTLQGEVAEVTFGSTSMTFDPYDSSVGLSLNVVTPDGAIWNETFGPGLLPVFIAPAGQDGLFKYELSTFVPTPANRSADGTTGVSNSGITDSQTGYFTVLSGSIVLPEADIQDPLPPGESLVTVQDQVILDDLIVDGSACVGFDCVNGEAFGFDTIRLKENNLRLHFLDTSNSASFPSNDWRIIINDTANGGGNYFAVEDSTGARVPFKVEAGAPTNALFVESTGDVGLGTSTPVLELHIADGDTPSVRLEQNGSSGWTPQTWDVAGNETNFFVRDVTNASRLPFRIRPNAPTSSIDIKGDGSVGFGTASPTQPLHLVTSGKDATLLVERTGGESAILSATATRVEVGSATPASVDIVVNSNRKMTVKRNGDVGIGTQNPTFPLEIQRTGENAGLLLERTDGDSAILVAAASRVRVGSATPAPVDVVVNNDRKMTVAESGAINMSNGARLTAGGVWTNASSRDLKENIVPLKDEDALATLRGLKPVTYNYKVDAREQYVGFIAEEAPDLVATEDRKGMSPMDVVAVLTKVVQEQQQTIETLNARLAAIEARDQ